MLVLTSLCINHLPNHFSRLLWILSWSCPTKNNTPLPFLCWYMSEATSLNASMLEQHFWSISMQNHLNCYRWQPECSLTLGICGWLKSLSTITPLTSCVSSSLPPTLPCTLISSKSTSLRSISATVSTAFTAISAICLWQRLTLSKREYKEDVLHVYSSEERNWLCQYETLIYVCIYMYVQIHIYIYTYILVLLIACLLYEERVSCSLVHLNMPNTTETRTRLHEHNCKTQIWNKQGELTITQNTLVPETNVKTGLHRKLLQCVKR